MPCHIAIGTPRREHLEPEMRQPADNARPANGPWARKKARTKTAIQQQALRLFHQQGYHATTVEQVAAAADVAPSTVFRYFPTKHDLAVLDDYLSLAPLLPQAWEAQPRDLSPIQALRGAIRAVYSSLSPTERAARYERDRLVLLVPELWAANAALITQGRRMLSELAAKRVGRNPDDPAVRALVDAAYGVGLGVLLDWAKDPGIDLAAALDEALAHLEAGLPL
jgi:AcrR family transcriptional regulator